MPLPPLQLSLPFSAPGAYHVQGLAGLKAGLAGTQTQRAGTEAEAENGNEIENELVNETGLAIADLVADDSENLPVAQPRNQTNTLTTERQEGKDARVQALFLLGAFGLCVIVAIVVAFTAPFKNDDTTIAATPATPEPTFAGTDSSTNSNISPEYVLSLLPAYTANIIANDTDGDSAQARALQWLLEDPLLPHMFHPQIKQRFILATLYHATDGDNWADNTDWLDYGVHECNWYHKEHFAAIDRMSALFPGWGATMFPPDNVPPKIHCDNDGMLIHLWLDENNLVGTSIPEELYLLTSLQTLSLGYNCLQGTVSSSIGQLSNLEGLSLVLLDTQGGTIPSEIGLLTKLRLFTSIVNNYQGTMPHESWKLHDLELISLGRNPGLQGTIPSFEIGQFSNLSWFLFHTTGLCDTLPTEIGELPSLLQLILLENHLAGTVPAELGQLSYSLQAISLRDNHMLEGTVPTELGLLSALTLLTFQHDNLSGRIPSELGLITDLAIIVDLGNNTFSGTIPTELGLLTSMRGYLSVSGNQLTGAIPSELGQISFIGWLDFANNSLSGTVPQELAPLKQNLLNALAFGRQ